MRLIFIGVTLIFIYGVYIGEEFLSGAAFSPLLIITYIWLFNNISKGER